MVIIIRKKTGMDKPAVLIRFNTNQDKFDSNYERNQFFRGLHGWKQVIVKKTQKTIAPDGTERTIEQRYVYPRSGLLDEVQHVKVADSAFIVAMEDMKRMQTFFHEWEKQVNAEFMQMMMPQKQWAELAEKKDEIIVKKKKSEEDELNSL